MQRCLTIWIWIRATKVSSDLPAFRLFDRICRSENVGDSSLGNVGGRWLYLVMEPSGTRDSESAWALPPAALQQQSIRVPRSPLTTYYPAAPTGNPNRPPTRARDPVRVAVLVAMRNPNRLSVSSHFPTRDRRCAVRQQRYLEGDRCRGNSPHKSYRGLRYPKDAPRTTHVA